MSQIPDEIKKKIEDWIKSFGYIKSKHGTWSVMEQSASFGYSSASEEVKRLKEENKELKKRIAEIVYLSEQKGGYHP